MSVTSQEKEELSWERIILSAEVTCKQSKTFCACVAYQQKKHLSSSYLRSKVKKKPSAVIHVWYYDSVLVTSPPSHVQTWKAKESRPHLCTLPCAGISDNRYDTDSDTRWKEELGWGWVAAHNVQQRPKNKQQIVSGGKKWHSNVFPKSNRLDQITQRSHITFVYFVFLQGMKYVKGT